MLSSRGCFRAVRTLATQVLPLNQHIWRGLSSVCVCVCSFCSAKRKYDNVHGTQAGVQYKQTPSVSTDGERHSTCARTQRLNPHSQHSATTGAGRKNLPLRLRWRKGYQTVLFRVYHGALSRWLGLWCVAGLQWYSVCWSICGRVFSGIIGCLSERRPRAIMRIIVVLWSFTLGCGEPSYFDEQLM